MTIHIGKRFGVAVLVVLLVAAAGAVGYKLGGDSKDVAGAVQDAKTQAKAAETQAFERGRAQGDSEGRKALVDQGNSQPEADSEVIKYLGYDRTDWKKNRWYAVAVTTRGGEGPDPKYVSVYDRTLMAPGLEYSLCGSDNSEICYRQG
jgi:hypothetical protein